MVVFTPCPEPMTHCTSSVDCGRKRAVYVSHVHLLKCTRMHAYLATRHAAIVEANQVRLLEGQVHELEVGLWVVVRQSVSVEGRKHSLSHTLLSYYMQVCKRVVLLLKAHNGL